MKNKERVFIGACCGIPFGIVGMVSGALFGILFNKICGRIDSK